MTEPRKRFQIHLSTAMVMMFVTGGVIWANTRGSTVQEEDTYLRITSLSGDFRYVSEQYLRKKSPRFAETIAESRSYGWPCPAMYVMEFQIRTEQGSIRFWHRSKLYIDAVVAMFILLAVWLSCEWLIRRRDARKGA